MVGLLLSVLSSGSLFAAGFLSGSEFTSTDIQGRLTVQCRSPYGLETAHFLCRANILDPSEYDYFVSDTQEEVKTVTLQNRVDGRDVKKTVNFNNAKGRSSQRFNLWIWSLTQRPLLNFGENTIQYEMKNGRAVVESGTFDVMVSEGEPRQCRGDVIYSNNPNDCRDGSSVCDQYFQQHNWCD